MLLSGDGDGEENSRQEISGYISDEVGGEEDECENSGEEEDRGEEDSGEEVGGEKVCGEGKEGIVDTREAIHRGWAGLLARV